jgi:3-phosphoshikimate 1-carboxyvinyltransferase
MEPIVIIHQGVYDMATCTFHPARLRGVAPIPPAKSEAHRALLIAALGEGPCRLHGFPPPLCDDTIAMINGVTALGATVSQEGNTLLVAPAPPACGTAQPVTCEVHACAAALRMLIPVFLLRGQPVRFEMEDALFARPLSAFDPLIAMLGATLAREPAGSGNRASVTLRGHMPAGAYEIDGSLSSQFASGMLIALGHAGSDRGTQAAASLHVKPPIVSRPYLDMTLRQMAQFGIPVEERGGGMFHLAPKPRRNPADVDVSPDWSQAAVFLCANAMGHAVVLHDMRTPADGKAALQGDSRIIPLLQEMGLKMLALPEGLFACCPSRAGLLPLHVDCANIPDLAPMLALTCTQARGVSVLTGVSRLRVKECDRLAATQTLLTRLGAQVTVGDDGDSLHIEGPASLKGGLAADAHGDHRMVMLLATAALLCDGPVVVTGVESINKSWPGFLATYTALGGEVT